MTCNKLSVCPTEAVTCTCMTGYSMMQSWISDKYTGRNVQVQFTSSDAVGTSRPGMDSNTFAELAVVSNMNGIPVIRSNLTVMSVRNNMPVVLACVNDRQNYTIIVPIGGKSICIKRGDCQV